MLPPHKCTIFIFKFLQVIAVASISYLSPIIIQTSGFNFFKILSISKSIFEKYNIVLFLLFFKYFILINSFCLILSLLNKLTVSPNNFELCDPIETTCELYFLFF